MKKIILKIARLNIFLSIFFLSACTDRFKITSEPSGARIYTQPYVRLHFGPHEIYSGFDNAKWEYKCTTPCEYKLTQGDLDFVAAVWDDGEAQVEHCTTDLRDAFDDPCLSYYFVKRVGQEEKWTENQERIKREADRRQKKADNFRSMMGVFVAGTMVAQDKLAPYQKNLSQTQQVGNAINKSITEEAFQIASKNNPELAEMRRQITNNVENDPIAAERNNQVNQIIEAGRKAEERRVIEQRTYYTRNATAGGSTVNSASDLLSRVAPWSCPGSPPRVRADQCMRDKYVAAAVMYAWAAECYLQAGDTVKAQQSTDSMVHELEVARSFCSDVPSMAGVNECDTIMIFPCPQIINPSPPPAAQRQNKPPKDEHTENHPCKWHYCNAAKRCADSPYEACE